MDGNVRGNFIGITPDGTTAAGNESGITVKNSTVTIGSRAFAGRGIRGSRNVISANISRGVGVLGSGSAGTGIFGNLIGTDRTALLERGNRGPGVSVFASAFDVTIGTEIAPNIIAANRVGVVVDEVRRVTLFANDYSSNSGLGIDLTPSTEGTGVTPNDAGDADAGGNGLQNFLDDGFSVTQVPTGVRVQGTLQRPASGSLTFTVAAYATSVCDGTGHGEGDFLGSATQVTTTGVAPIDVTIPLSAQLAVGELITTTVTTADGSTSEFSRCVEVEPSVLAVFANGFE